MIHGARLLGAGLLLTACVGTRPPAAPPARAAGPVLDWDARMLWVHEDHVAAAGVARFEGARRQWLERLRADGGSLADGRPLFFAEELPDGGRVYRTFYPFAAWADLDRRAAAKGAVEARLGAAALADYDAGDAALVPPHHSAIWTRLTDSDLAPSAGAGDLRRAAFARLELRTLPTASAAAELDAVWREVQRTRGTTDACRVFWNLYGGGELVLFWPKADRAATAENPLPPTLSARLEAVAPLLSVHTLVRRDDLSTVAPPR